MTKEEFRKAYSELRMFRCFGETVYPAFRGGFRACKQAAEANSVACWLEREIEGRIFSRAIYGLAYAAAAQAMADNY